MDAAREAELAAEMGLDAVPKPRMPVPEPHKPVPDWVRPKFLKALQLVDQIETWAFERFIPDFCVIDQNLDAHVFSREYSFAVCIRTDQPPPSNQTVWRATGVKPAGHPGAMGADNFYRWLGIEVANMYREIGARRMGVPLVYRTKGSRWNPLIVPYLGAICKFDRTPPDGMRMEELVASTGVLIPAGTPVKPDHIVTPVADVVPFDSGSAFRK